MIVATVSSTSFESLGIVCFAEVGCADEISFSPTLKLPDTVMIENLCGLSTM